MHKAMSMKRLSIWEWIAQNPDLKTTENLQDFQLCPRPPCLTSVSVLTNALWLHGQNSRGYYNDKEGIILKWDVQKVHVNVMGPHTFSQAV